MKKHEIKPAQRITMLDEYIFTHLDKIKSGIKNEDLIDLGEGNPDLEPHPELVEKLYIYSKKPGSQKYPSRWGCNFFNDSVRIYLNKGLSDREIMPLMGTKEGIAHISMSLFNEGDKILIPNPGFPVYKRAANFAGAKAVSFPLTEKNDYMPNPYELKQKGIKFIWLNYPNNPSGATCSKEYFKLVLDYCKDNSCYVCNDAAYAGLNFIGTHTSILSMKNAKDYAVEMHSFSKSLSIAGWRVGFLAGNQEIIKNVELSKSVFDSGMFIGMQKTAGFAMRNFEKFSNPIRRVYEERSKYFYHELKKLGWEVKKPSSTFYIWAKPPGNPASGELAEKLLAEGGIITIPGHAFGSYGEGYIRFSMVKELDTLKKAIERIKNSVP